jgi:hypothetical protein
MSRPDRALRGIVADLGALHTGDVAAILDCLTAEERRAVEGLLNEYAAQFAPQPAAVDGAGFDAAKFSPWLAQLLREDDSASTAMTARARLALRECAARLCPQSAVPAARPGLLERMGSLFAPGSRAP